jgi:hypothetical protein
LHYDAARGKILLPEVVILKKTVLIPYEKLSKKAKKELDRRKRRDWGGISPVTRKPDNPRAYNRKKEKARSLDVEDPLRVFVDVV